MSQATAMEEILVKSGHEVVAVFLGGSGSVNAAPYFSDRLGGKLIRFRSPGLSPSKNRKGIRVGKSIWINVPLIPLYLGEVKRIRGMITDLKPDMVINFYEGIGALAMRGIDPGIVRIGIGHHFFLHLDGYRCSHGSRFHRWLLQMHTRLIIRSCDMVMALSFRKAQGSGKVCVIPPLIREDFKKEQYIPGKRFLVYLLHEGYLYDLLLMARKNPEFEADVFTGTPPLIVMPPALKIHAPEFHSFRSKMAMCRGLITTAGFDTLAEAAFLGVPILAVPAQHHFEQCCNGEDLIRSGLGMSADKLLPGVETELKSGEPGEYRSWVQQAEPLLLENLALAVKRKPE